MIHLPLSLTFSYLLPLEPFLATSNYLAGHIRLRDLTQKGDGHPVLVLPGLGTSGAATADLRTRLQQLGYAVYDWKHGTNFGPGIDFNMWLDLIGDHLQQIAGAHQSLVSVIGWSFGGTYARELAKTRPDLIRQVITLATPFADASPTSSEFGSTSPKLSKSELALRKRLSEVPAVPSASIYSKLDGIVSWRQCIAPEAARHRNIEVEGVSHFGMVHHPAVLRVLARLLKSAEKMRVKLR